MVLKMYLSSKFNPTVNLGVMSVSQFIGGSQCKGLDWSQVGQKMGLHHIHGVDVLADETYLHT